MKFIDIKIDYFVILSKLTIIDYDPWALGAGGIFGLWMSSRVLCRNLVVRNMVSVKKQDQIWCAPDSPVTKLKCSQLTKIPILSNWIKFIKKNQILNFSRNSKGFKDINLFN